MKKPPNRLQFATRGRKALSYDWLQHDFAKDPGPLLEALRSNIPIPKHLRDVMVDLFERYQLKLKVGAKRIPSYRRKSDSEAKLEAAREELRLVVCGRITRGEMDHAVKILETRAKRQGRGRILKMRMAAARQLRDEARARIAAYYGLDQNVFEKYLAGKRGSSRR